MSSPRSWPTRSGSRCAPVQQVAGCGRGRPRAHRGYRCDTAQACRQRVVGAGLRPGSRRAGSPIHQTANCRSAQQEGENQEHNREKATQHDATANDEVRELQDDGRPPLCRSVLTPRGFSTLSSVRPRRRVRVPMRLPEGAGPRRHHNKGGVRELRFHGRTRGSCATFLAVARSTPATSSGDFSAVRGPVVLAADLELKP